ncbi:hypothetical protein L218DRAFT_948929 [Marasmius fiardii PR-910]|nr:hypothetical protein L218DRAFT_948929 [Marasmius fiardii PR-910]
MATRQASRFAVGERKVGNTAQSFEGSSGDSTPFPIEILLTHLWDLRYIDKDVKLKGVRWVTAQRFSLDHPIQRRNYEGQWMLTGTLRGGSGGKTPQDYRRPSIAAVTTGRERPFLKVENFFCTKCASSGRNSGVSAVFVIVPQQTPSWCLCRLMEEVAATNGIDRFVDCSKGSYGRPFTCYRTIRSVVAVINMKYG